MPTDFASAAEGRAAAKPAAQSNTSTVYSDLFGPIETPGGHGDAYIVRNGNTDVDYIEYRPRSGGRIKRAPLVGASAVFRAMGWTPPPKPRKKSPAKSGK